MISRPMGPAAPLMNTCWPFSCSVNPPGACGAAILVQVTRNLADAVSPWEIKARGLDFSGVPPRGEAVGSVCKRRDQRSLPEGDVVFCVDLKNVSPSS